MIKTTILLSIFFSFNAYSFVLLNPKYELHDAESAKVMISSEGCRANGISDSEVKKGIEWAVEFWNDVPESRLKLKYGGKSSASLSDNRVPKNQIIIGCGSLPSNNILGATQNDRTNGSAKVTMNQAVYTGNYNVNGFIGTMTHEIGHGIGLFHSKDAASVMTYSNHDWVDRPKYISQDDIDGVVYLYPNEKSLAGLLGSCSSFAHDESTKHNFIFDFVLSFLSVLGVAWIIRKIKILSND